MEFGYFADAFGLSLSETLSETFRSAQSRDSILTHHKLKVYEKALALGAGGVGLSGGWGDV